MCIYIYIIILLHFVFVENVIFKLNLNIGHIHSRYNIKREVVSNTEHIAV